MTEISVIVDKDVQNLYDLPPDDRLAVLEHLIETRQITHIGADSIYELISKQREWTEKTSSNDIAELLVRKIIFALDDINKSIIPIVALSKVKFGSAEKPGSVTTLTTTINKRTQCVTPNKIPHIVPAYNEMKIQALQAHGLPFNFTPTLLKDDLIKLFNLQVSYLTYIMQKHALVALPPIIPHNFYPKSPEFAVSKLFQKIDALGWNKLPKTFMEAAIYELHANGFFPAYKLSLLKGVDSSDVENELTERKKIERWKSFLNENKIKQTEIQNKLSTLMTIIEQKLGKSVKKIEAAIRETPTLKSFPDKILDILPANEASLIKQEYQRRQKYTAAYFSNKCPHLSVMKKYRAAVNQAASKTLFNDVRNYFGEKTGGLHYCRLCKFEIMCSHEVEYTENMFAGTQPSQIKANMNKYIDFSIHLRSIFCKYCGEIISTGESFIATESNQIMDEELKTFLWVEVAVLMKTLKFDKLVDTSQLITSIRDSIYSFMFDMEKQILKSKTNTAAETKAKKKLYATIYAFAYIIRLVMSNKNISFKGFQPSAKNPLVDIIKHVIGLIVSLRNVVIRDIVGMNQDIIKNSLIEAYKMMNHMGSQIISITEAPEDLNYIVKLDPVFKYVYKFNKSVSMNLASKKGGSKITKPKSTKLSKLTKQKPQDTALINELIGIDNFSKIKRPQIGNIEFKWAPSYKIVDVNQPHMVIIKKSFMQFMNSVENRVYDNKIYKESGIKPPRGDPLAIAAPITLGVYLDNWKQWDEINAQENIYLFYKKAQTAKTFTVTHFGKTESTRMFFKQHDLLSRVYDEDGNLHKFEIGVFRVAGDAENAKDNITEQTAGQLATAINKGVVENLKLIDYRCSVCKILKSETVKLSESKIRESIESKTSSGNFFRFYEQRCPEGNVHEFDGNVCKKCGLDLTWKPQSVFGIEYYKKYRGLYVKQREEFKTNIVFTEPHQVPETGTEFKDWNHNFNSILQLAKIADVNSKAIAALGDTEKIDYNEIISGTFIPAETEEYYITRNYKITSYIRGLLLEYNLLRNYQKIIKPSREIIALIDDSKFPKHKLNELPVLLPERNDDIKELDFQRQRKPRELTNYLIQRFCEISMLIMDTGNKQTEELRKMFVIRFVKKILRGEELLSKHGWFNYSMLYSMEKTRDYDSNFVEETKGEEAVEDDDETATPMEQMFDAETDIPEGEEDGENSVRVEGYGLD